MNTENEQSTELTHVARQEVITDQLGQLTRSAERDQLMLLEAKFSYSQRLAKMFAFSGCFADVRDQREEVALAKALVKIKLGESMGFSEAESMTGIDIIQGRVAVGASLRAARMQRAGFSWPQMTCTDKGCWIPLCLKGEPILQQKVDDNCNLVFKTDGSPAMSQVVVSFTENDAKNAGLAAKDNYKKDPSSMYFARAITRAQRRYGPGVLGIDVLDTYEAKDMDPSYLPTLSPGILNQSAAQVATEAKSPALLDKMKASVDAVSNIESGAGVETVAATAEAVTPAAAPVVITPVSEPKLSSETVESLNHVTALAKLTTLRQDRTPELFDAQLKSIDGRFTPEGLTAMSPARLADTLVKMQQMGSEPPVAQAKKKLF